MKTTFFKIPVKLKGSDLVVGKKIPYFDVVDTQGRRFTHLSFMGKKIIINTFPDINTEVCNLQARKMIERVQGMENVVLLNFSTNSIKDFNNWCANEGLDSIMISDPEAHYALQFGLRLPLIKRYARAVVLVDEEGYIEYIEVTKDITDEPKYNQIIGKASL